MKYDKIIRGEYTYFRYRHWDPVLKKITRELTARTLKDLKEKVEKFEKLEGYGIKNDKVKLVDFCNDWLYNVHLVDKKPSTQERYDCIFRLYMKKSYLGQIILRNLDASDVQKYYNELFERKGYNCVKQFHKMLSPCIRYAFETGRIIRNFMPSIKLPKKPAKNGRQKKVNPLTVEEHKRFINVIKDHRLGVLFNMALDTGMRQGELFALTWRDIDFSRKEINIDKTYSLIRDLKTHKQIGETTAPKTYYSTRIISLPKRTEELLMAHKEKQKIQLAKYNLTQDNDTLVFCTGIGTHLERQNVLKEVKAVYKECGILNVDGKVDKTFHDLRHTYATRLFELGEPAKVVQELLGHSDVSTTLNIYTHVLERQKKRTASKIDLFYEESFN